MQVKSPYTCTALVEIVGIHFVDGCQPAKMCSLLLVEIKDHSQVVYCTKLWLIAIHNIET